MIYYQSNLYLKSIPNDLLFKLIMLNMNFIYLISIFFFNNITLKHTFHKKKKMFIIIINIMIITFIYLLYIFNTLKMHI